MADIRHRVGIQAAQADVYEKLSTTAGVASWWTHDVVGDAAKGGRFEVYFGSPEPSAVIEVVEASPARGVVWRVVEGPDEWLDSIVTYALTHAGDETVIDFTHAWRESSDFMAHCSTKWGYFLLELKAGLEGGKAHAFPDDVKISSWDR